MSYDATHDDSEDEYINDYDKSTYIPPLSDSDDDEDDIQSNVSKYSIVSRNKSSQRMNDIYKTVTQGTVCVRDAHKKRGIKRINAYYTSMTPGAPIRNALTGIYENDYTGNTKCAVGSPWEDLFFKVIITTTKEGPTTLFYDSPEQCNRHLDMCMSDEVIKNWYPKYQYAVSQLKIVQEDFTEQKTTIIR